MKSGLSIGHLLHVIFLLLQSSDCDWCLLFLVAKGKIAVSEWVSQKGKKTGKQRA